MYEIVLYIGDASIFEASPIWKNQLLMKLLYTWSKQLTIASFVSAIAQLFKVVLMLMFDIVFLIIPKHNSIALYSGVYGGV